MLAHSRRVFPASPSRAVNTYSIQFLRFTLHISTRSGVAVNALADALHGFYAEQGLYLLNNEVCKCHIFLLSPWLRHSLQGSPLNDPLREALGNAIKHCSTLKESVDSVIDATLERASQLIDQQQPKLKTPIPYPKPVAGPSNLCHPILRDRCPLCFGGICCETLDSCVLYLIISFTCFSFWKQGIHIYWHSCVDWR